MLEFAGSESASFLIASAPESLMAASDEELLAFRCME